MPNSYHILVESNLHVSFFYRLNFSSLNLSSSMINFLSYFFILFFFFFYVSFSFPFVVFFFSFILLWTKLFAVFHIASHNALPFHVGLNHWTILYSNCLQSGRFRSLWCYSTTVQIQLLSVIEQCVQRRQIYAFDTKRSRHSLHSAPELLGFRYAHVKIFPAWIFLQTSSFYFICI